MLQVSLWYLEGLSEADPGFVLNPIQSGSCSRRARWLAYERQIATVFDLNCTVILLKIIVHATPQMTYLFWCIILLLTRWWTLCHCATIAALSGLSEWSIWKSSGHFVLIISAHLKGKMKCILCYLSKRSFAHNCKPFCGFAVYLVY